LLNSCPLCGSNKTSYDFAVNGNSIYECKDCLHLFVNPQPSNIVFDNKNNSIEYEKVLKAKIEINKSQKYNILEIGSSILNNNNYTTTNIKDINLFLENVREEKAKYDLCILNNILDYSNDPCIFLQKIHECLKKNSHLMFYIPVLDSKDAKRLKLKWPVFSSNRLHYFSVATIQNILSKCGYEQIELSPADDNGIFVTCRTGIPNNEKIISIIIPVYNEERTIEILLDRVINKQLNRLKKEIIIIESNSTDSTREIVKRFVKDHPETKLVLEEKPRGKGHAVRNGFNEATGDFIAIQDGDLEYDINDYDQLVEPLVNYQRAFVLGSRHAGDWKMRNFNEKKITAVYKISGCLGCENPCCFLLNITQFPDYMVL